MSAIYYRAFRFAHPDLEEPGMRHGLVIGPSGNLAMVEGDAAIRQSLLLLVSTSPGERVMRPDYGCDLRKILFWPNDATTAGLAIHYVRQAVQRWEPRVQILSVDANALENKPTLLLIELSYRVIVSQETDELAFALNLAQE